jgi:hypothetical protein
MKTTTFAVAVALAGLLAACAETKRSTGTASSASAKSAGPDVKVNPAAVVRASQPPPATASQTTTAGHGNLSVNTANSPTDSDPTWIESIDVDLDGSAEAAEYTYDDDDKVTYIFANVSFPCINGNGTFKGGMLTAVYGLNNTWGKAPGAGWYVTELNAGQCAAAAKALWGCRFDATGARTECGWATIQADKDDIIITAGDVK